MKKYRLFISSTLLWLVADLLSKRYVETTDCCSGVLIEDFLYFTNQQNSGVAFGIEVPYLLLVIAILVILGTLIHFGFTTLFKQGRNLFLNQVLLGIIIGGALGNLINRLIQGAVTDFIVLKPFPVFNIADVGVTIGLILLVITNLELFKK